MATQTRTEEARNAMVDALIAYQEDYGLRPFSDPVMEAMRTVPRDKFAPPREERGLDRYFLGATAD